MEKTLAYPKICLFTANYESVCFIVQAFGRKGFPGTKILYLFCLYVSDEEEKYKIDT